MRNSAKQTQIWDITGGRGAGRFQRENNEKLEEGLLAQAILKTEQKL